MASLPQLRAPALEVRPVRFPKVVGIDEMPLAVHLEAVEAGPLPEGELQFVAVEDLEDQDLVAGVAQVGQSGKKSLRVAEAVGKNDEQAAAVQAIVRSPQFRMVRGREFVE